MIVGILNSEKISFIASDQISEHNSQGILFYPRNIFRTGELFEDSINSFEEAVSQIDGGIDGMFVFVWVYSSDHFMKDQIIERLKLKERGCVWGFGSSENSEMIPQIDQFFKENLRVFLKPAKRERN